MINTEQKIKTPKTKRKNNNNIRKHNENAQKYKKNINKTIIFKNHKKRKNTQTKI